MKKLFNEFKQAFSQLHIALKVITGLFIALLPNFVIIGAGILIHFHMLQELHFGMFVIFILVITATCYCILHLLTAYVIHKSEFLLSLKSEAGNILRFYAGVGVTYFCFVFLLSLFY